MEITPVHTVNFCGVLSESRRILNANSSHFLALSLFFIPLAFSLAITPSIHLHLPGNFFTGDLFLKFLANHPKAVIFPLLYILIVYIFTLFAIATVSYSTYQVLMGKPVNYLAALKSLTFSFFPLVSTTIVALILLSAISLTFYVLAVKILMLGKIIGFAIDYNNSIYFIVVGAACIATVIYVHMNWCLASIVVVAESKWGVEALMRSWYLVKGIRSVASSLLLYFLFSIAFYTWSSSNAVNVSSNTLVVVLFTMVGSFLPMMCLLSSIIVNTVLYMYCKAFHGELALEIGGRGVSLHNINLPSDHEKAPHVVTVVEA